MHTHHNQPHKITPLSKANRDQMFLMLFFLSAFAPSCNTNNHLSDAYGNFEAKEMVVSAGSTGQIMEFNVDEGQRLEAGQIVGYIDTTQLYLKKLQLLAARKSIAAKTGNIVAQIDVLKKQKEAALKEKERFEKLVARQAATQKQLDDILAQLDVIDAQIKAIETQNAPVVSEIESLDSQLMQLDDQIRKSIIVNFLRGTVLAKYAERYELTATGKPLYKIANLDTMTLRVFVSGAQLPQISIDQHVYVLFDNGKNGLDTLTGQIYWIADQAEFTPKTIQTREERVSLVYAVKIKVKNDGRLKIGMPGEMMLITNKNP
ncbi:MAG: membrane protein [Chitinophagales bacterium]|nr:MAG: membrane protein [Chitinophagales bacterium]